MSATKTVRFLCVDDDKKVEPLCTALSEALPNTQLVVDRQAPKRWETEVAGIMKAIADRTVDGVLLDYRLDENATVPAEGASSSTKAGTAPTLVPVSYTADSLIQELRRKSVEKGDLTCPIVLWSHANRLEEFHAFDPEFREHYDLVIDKDRIEPVAEFSRTLVSLVNGYQRIKSCGAKSPSVTVFLAPPDEDLVGSIETFFKNIYPDGAFPYQSALFIIHQILYFDGPLIGQSMLRAILGVEPSSLPSKATEHLLSSTQYQGVFSEGFTRWWKAPLLSRLDALIDGTWMKLDCKKRSLTLGEKFEKTSLVPVDPLQADYSGVYDTYCSFSHRPLNRINGYALFEESPRVWKDTKFIAGSELRKNYGAAAKHLKLDEGEERRFKARYERKPSK